MQKPQSLDEVIEVQSVGQVIYDLVKKGTYKDGDKKFNQAAELAYQAFGIDRAIKVYLNLGLSSRAVSLAENKGYKKLALDICKEYGFHKDGKRIANELNDSHSTETFRLRDKRKPKNSTITGNYLFI